MKLYMTETWKKYTDKEPTEWQREQISQIQRHHKIKNYQIRIIADFCEVGLTESWLEAYNKVLMYIKRGGTNTLESYQLRYGVIEGERRFKLIKSSRCNTLESFVRRHGEIEGLVKYNSFCLKNRGNKSLERFIFKYGDKEGVEKFNKLRNSEMSRGTESYFINRYGDKKGREIFKSKIKSLNFGASTEGFIFKYGADEGLKKIKERKNNTSLKSYITRYGEEIGLLKYNNLILRKKFFNTLESYIQRYGEQAGPIKYNKWLETSAVGIAGYSKISQQLFDEIDQFNTYTYYATKNKEFVLNTDIGVFFFDYVNIKSKKIIEFNGDIYHGNPTIYKSDDTPNPFNKTLTCEDMWAYDEKKINQAKLRGYDILVIWEKDFKINKNYEIDRCKEFLGI